MRVQAAGARIAAVDALRGIALLGILVLNLPGYAWPEGAMFLGPRVPGATIADDWAWAAGFILFDGRMRGLFALLFGVSMALMLDRSADQAGVDAGSGREEVAGADAGAGAGVSRQRRRLGWLAVFGILHYLLLWHGDILFSYAMLGLVLLAKRALGVRAQLGLAVALLLGGMVVNAPSFLPLGAIEAAALAPGADDAARTAWTVWREALGLDAAYVQAVDTARAGWTAGVAHRAADWSRLAFGVMLGAFDVLPMMLVGMAAVRVGWLHDARLLRRVAAVAIPVGLGAYAVMAAVAWRAQFAPSMIAGLQLVWAAIPRAVGTLGYAAGAMLLLTAHRDTALVRRLRDAGRVALSNYIGMSLVMVPLFAAGNAALFAIVPPAALWLAILAGWAFMLGWPGWWLARHRQGPLEWIWRVVAGRP